MGMARVMAIPNPYPYPCLFSVYSPHTHFFQIFRTHTRYKWGGFGGGFWVLGVTHIPNFDKEWPKLLSPQESKCEDRNCNKRKMRKKKEEIEG